MKKAVLILLILSILLCTGCAAGAEDYQVVTTTLPVYDFTSALCQGTDLKVGRLVTENVSCLHDYTLKVDQMRMIEGAEMIVISGAGLEDFLEDALTDVDCLDASQGVHIHALDEHHDHGHHEDHGHSHHTDPHIWLSPENAGIMAANICQGLVSKYPEHRATLEHNLTDLLEKLDALQEYGDETLSQLTCRELITFHDGFGYFAESFDLTILEAVEEESGSEASALELIHLADMIQTHDLPAIFTERSGSDASAGILCRETGAAVHTLDMAMAGDSYFEAMYHNINTIKEALK